MQRLASIDQRLGGANARLALSTLRLLGHPSLPSILPRYLVQVLHTMRAAGAVMEAARSRAARLAPECAVAAALVPYWTRHIADEAGHDAWMAEDLARLGVDAERALRQPPLPDVALLLERLRQWAVAGHPAEVLSYFFVIERHPPSVELLDWLVAHHGIRRDALTTFYRHAVIDREHGRELERLIEGLPLTVGHLDRFVASAVVVTDALARIADRVVEREGDPGPSVPGSLRHRVLPDAFA